ncbi:hypothetical protein ABZ915_02370 [Streptomyces sp. NPDC046915]|uniref:hypothetical protein n=1 Tax=Streptomyces sp. NPDC046915 TaxID=3155257 RepID=UPI0033DEDA8A
MGRTSADPDRPVLFWPFLISRGRTATYRVVVAPDFLCEAGLAGVLWDLAGGSLTERGQARYRVVSSRAGGSFVIMFRVLLPEPGSDRGSGTPPRDEHGRRIPVITGVVERGAAFTAGTGVAVLDEAHDRCLPALRTFWDADRAMPPRPSPAFSAPRRAGAALTWQELPPYEVPDEGPTPPGAGRRDDGPGAAGPGKPPAAAQAQDTGGSRRIAMAGLAVGIAAAGAVVLRGCGR